MVRLLNCHKDLNANTNRNKLTDDVCHQEIKTKNGIHHRTKSRMKRSFINLRGSHLYNYMSLTWSKDNHIYGIRNHCVRTSITLAYIHDTLHRDDGADLIIIQGI